MPLKNRVRERRTELKDNDPRFTQEYVAHEINITLSAYRSIELGFADPKVSTAIKLARLFNTSVESLFGW